LNNLPPDHTLQPSEDLAHAAVALDEQESPAHPPDPVRYDADRGGEPVWMAGKMKQPFSPIEQAAFEQPLTEDARESHQRVQFVPPHLPSAAADAVEVDDEPIFITDIDESKTPERLMEQARQLAEKAATLEELLEVSEICGQVLAGNPPVELDAPARKLAALAHNRRGELLLDAGNQEEAAQALETAITLDVECAEAIHNRAVLAAERSDFDAALADFNRVIQLDPTQAIAYRNRAELLAAQGKLDDAVDDYSRAVKGMPDDAELYRARAHALQSAGKFDDALDDLNRSIQLDPTSAQSLLQRGNIMAERGEFGHALADFKQSIAVDASFADAYRSLAWLHATCPTEKYRNDKAAIAAAKRAVEISNGADFFSLEAMAAALANAGQFDAAVETQQRALQAAPEQSTASVRQRLSLYESKRPFRSRVLSGTADR
jgi:tetratricopeptide (TPR) repeat protein